MFVTIVICVYVRQDDDEQGWNSSQEVTHTACDLQYRKYMVCTIPEHHVEI